MSCSGLDPAIRSVLAAREQQTRAQIQFAVAAQQLDAVAQQGDAAQQLIEQSLALSKSLTSGAAFDAQA